VALEAEATAMVGKAVVAWEVAATRLMLESGELKCLK